MAKNHASQKTASSRKFSKRKEIHALIGGTNCGKSSTMKEVYRILSIKYPNCILRKSKKYGYDMKIEMKIKIGIEDVLIGIDTFGDSKPHIETILNDFASKGCNIIFCVENTEYSAQPQKTIVGQFAKLHSYKLIPTSQNAVIKNNSVQAMTNYKTAEKIIKQADI
jgi:ABC-type dipeptide/oligopeptide/nickel transport system ATPase component